MNCNFSLYDIARQALNITSFVLGYCLFPNYVNIQIHYFYLHSQCKKVIAFR